LAQLQARVYIIGTVLTRRFGDVLPPKPRRHVTPATSLTGRKKGRKRLRLQLPLLRMLCDIIWTGRCDE